VVARYLNRYLSIIVKFVFPILGQPPGLSEKSAIKIIDATDVNNIFYFHSHEDLIKPY